jgi:hypothetical protein
MIKLAFWHSEHAPNEQLMPVAPDPVFTKTLPKIPQNLGDI